MARLFVRLRLIGVAVMLLLAAFVALPASAQAANEGNYVENSGLSTANLLVCGSPYGCQTVVPGYYTAQVSTWKPTQVWVTGYTCVLFRVQGWDGWTSPWDQFCGGSAGAWFNVETIQDFYGGYYVGVHIIANDPR